MPNHKIFCIVPWTNTHQYWHGQYGACCYEAHPPQGNVHTLKHSSLTEWRNSSAMQNFRQRIMSDQPLSECEFCYREEQLGHESRRIKENYKAAIFTKQAFDRSFEYSKWARVCEQNTDVDPADWHIDFGNECNLACKMCVPRASSRIAAFYDKWQIKYDKQANWTNDQDSWLRFLDNVDQSKKIFRIHVMGGEPTISKRFVEFVEHLVAQGRTNISISFVSNGTVINQKLIALLMRFHLVNIEISIESVDANNNYIRQGSDIENILSNIEWLQGNTNFQIVLRTVPQLLSINTYARLLQWAFDRQLSVQSIPLFYPEYLQVNLLPIHIREIAKQDIINLKNQIQSHSGNNINTVSTGRDISRLAYHMIRECDTMIALLSQLPPDNVEQLRQQLITWLSKWDSEFNLDARIVYPEYREFLESYGYRTI